MFPVLSSKMQRLWINALLISVSILGFLKCSESSGGLQLNWMDNKMMSINHRMPSGMTQGTGNNWQEKMGRKLPEQELTTTWKDTYKSISEAQGVHVDQFKAMCLYGNDGQDMVEIVKYYYNTVEYVEFDSRVGKFVAKSIIGKPLAEQWNNDTDVLTGQQGEIDSVCRNNYEIYKGAFLNWTVTPTVTIKPTVSVNAKNSKLLTCFATGFYPPKMNISWLRNGKEVTYDISSTGIIQNGDWTYQIQLTLEMTPKTGEKYSCRVEHSSLSKPKIVDWNPEESQSAKNKLITGIGGFILGGIFTVVGLVVYLRNKKGYCTRPREPVSFQLLPAFCFAPDGEQNATDDKPVA